MVSILNDRQWPERATVEGPAFIEQRFGLNRMLDETIALYGLTNVKSLSRGSVLFNLTALEMIRSAEIDAIVPSFRPDLRS